MKDLQIVIPLTGYGSRFVAAGFDRLKPFIEVHGTPMIEWVVRMFPGYEDRIVFICRQAHLDTLPYMRPELERIAPQARILGLRDWQKKGPVADVLRTGDLIQDNAPVLVSYCDFYMHWNFLAFLRQASERGCDGAVPCYSGFHPHLQIADNLYASCRVDDSERLIAIREKFSWEEDKALARHSPGVYYMRTGALLKTYFQRLVDKGAAINGEYYASMPYQFMADDGLDVWCPANVSKFCQWGTPRDLADYLFWTETVLGARASKHGHKEGQA